MEAVSEVGVVGRDLVEWSLVAPIDGMIHTQGSTP